MGIFADRCHALIDENGRALSGAALEEARKDPAAARCGNKVKKAARFCSKCGSPPPGAWWQCPQCGKPVGAESQFCWNCKAQLYPDQRGDVASGRWTRPAGVFAERFEVGDLRRLLEKGLIVEEGTRALLLDAGQYKDVLEPGKHTLESTARKINHWGDAPPRTVVLVQTGDLILPLRLEGLRSADELELRFYGEVIVRLDPGRGLDFITNLLGAGREVDVESIAERLLGEVRYGVTNFCNATRVEDIVKDPDRRLRLEDSLRESLQAAAERYGLELVRMSAVEFYGKAYDALRQKAGDVEARRRELEFEQRLREAEKGDALHAGKSEHDVALFVRQLAHERGVSAQKQDHELERLRRQFGREEAGADAEHTEDVRDLQNERRLRREEAEEQSRLARAREALELKRSKKELQREDLQKRGAILDQLDTRALTALLDDPQKRAELQAMAKEEALGKRSTEEILALRAGEDPQAMLALQEYLRQRNEIADTERDKREKLSEQHAAQLERVLDKALDKMGDAAKGSGSQTTINK